LPVPGAGRSEHGETREGWLYLAVILSASMHGKGNCHDNNRAVGTQHRAAKASWPAKFRWPERALRAAVVGVRQTMGLAENVALGDGLTRMILLEV
jgi:hypothetical protein